MHLTDEVCSEIKRIRKVLLDYKLGSESITNLIFGLQKVFLLYISRPKSQHFRLYIFDQKKTRINQKIKSKLKKIVVK